ncbi:YdeI/OmpD-associated family protein [Cellulomonas sp. URHB0016]
MAGSRDDAPQVHAETVQEWRAWLLEHHADTPGAWLVSWKSTTGRPSVRYELAVEEALSVGWIDSSGRTLDDERHALWFTRRKPGSGWAGTNKERVARLEADGRMTPAGRAVVEAAKADGSWSLLDDVENLVIPPDLTAALERYPGAAEQWEAFPPSYRRATLQWIVYAKREATRAARLDETARLAQEGKRANQWPRT